jgi:TPR repeat protein
MKLLAMLGVALLVSLPASVLALNDDEKFDMMLEMTDGSEAYVDPVFKNVKIMTVEELERYEPRMDRIHEAENLFRIGTSFYFGGIDKNGSPGLRSIKKANIWLRRAAKKGHGKSMLALASIARDQGSITKYVKYILMATRIKGTPMASAFYDMGEVYEKGIGRFPNKERALENYQKAASLGVKEAHIKLADWSIKGLITGEQDFVSAIDHYTYVEENADNDRMASQMALKIAEIYGWIASANPNANDEESFKWLKKAADAGNVASFLRVGNAYQEGLGVDKDMDVAVQWYKKAAAKGVVNAMEILGYTYANGLHGTEEDYCEARKWYLDAAERDSVDASWNLGFFYSQGFCLEKDLGEAKKWFDHSKNLVK